MGEESHMSYWQNLWAGALYTDDMDGVEQCSVTAWVGH